MEWVAASGVLWLGYMVFLGTAVQALSLPTNKNEFFLCTVMFNIEIPMGMGQYLILRS